MRRLLLSAFAFVLVLSACGDGDSTAEEAGADAEANAAADSTEAPVSSTTSTTALETTTTTVEETTTTTSPYLVNHLDAANRGAETSQQASNGQLPVKTYERFELATGDTVAGVEWQGIYSFCDDRDGLPDPHATGFLIEIYRDGGDGPDLDAGPVYTSTFDVADTSQTLDDTFDQTCTNRPESTWAFYGYEVGFDEPYVADGGPQWLLIQAITADFSTFWGWQSASTGQPSLQEFNGEFTEVSTGSRAYALIRG